MRLFLVFLFSCFLVFLFGVMIAAAAPAYAQCTNPAGVEGQIVYNQTHKVSQFCDGTDWHSMKAANAGLRDDCTNNEVLKWDGSDWSCAADSGVGSETDPKVGTLTNGKWCMTDGNQVVCTSDAPGGEPQGTQCGMARSASSNSNCETSSYTSIATCNGVSIISSCPSGYTRISVHTGYNSGGPTHYCFRTCSKN